MRLVRRFPLRLFQRDALSSQRIFKAGAALTSTWLVNLVFRRIDRRDGATKKFTKII
jgi:hypothetical protein